MDIWDRKLKDTRKFGFIIFESAHKGVCACVWVCVSTAVTVGN